MPKQNWISKNPPSDKTSTRNAEVSNREGYSEIDTCWRKTFDMNTFPRGRRRKLDRLVEDNNNKEAILPSHSHEPGR